MDHSDYIEATYEHSRKKKRYAYLLWLTIGWLGFHRIYAGHTKTGVAQMILSLTGIGFVMVTFWWWLIDAFLLPDMIEDHNHEMLTRLHSLAPPPQVGADEGRSEREEPRRIERELDPRREAMLADLRKTGYRKERSDPIARLYQ